MDSKKTQTVVVIILVFTALLGILGAGIVYYLSTQDGTVTDKREQKEYCACITAYTTTECNDCACTEIETQVIDSQIGEVVDGKCSLECPVGETEDTVICLIPQVQATSCHSLSILNSNTREPLVPPINTDSTIVITSNFVASEYNGQEEEFTSFEFIVNGVSTEIKANNVPSTMVNGQNTYMPEMEFSNFQDIDTLTIQAIAYSDREPDGTPPGRYCYKQYDVEQTRGAFCSSLDVFLEGDKINQIDLNTPNLMRSDDISFEFSFDHEDLEDVRTRRIPQDLLEEILVGEKIFLEYSHLYDMPNIYTNEKGLPRLDNTVLDVDSVTMSVQLYVNNTPVDSDFCTTNISLTPETVVEPDPVVDVEPEPVVVEPDPVTPPDIHLTMEGPTCVSKLGRANYRITISNNSDTQQGITKITNKLPLGFEYITTSTTVNRSTISDNLLEVTSVGQSQELVWSNDWTIPANGTLTLEYGATVTTEALDGNNQNEAVATPVNVPEDMSRLRAEVVTKISDACEQPTGLPDTSRLTLLSFIVGSLVLVFGILVYQGRIDLVNSIMYNTVHSKPVKKILMPRKEFFEDSILEKEEKEK